MGPPMTCDPSCDLEILKACGTDPCDSCAEAIKPLCPALDTLTEEFPRQCNQKCEQRIIDTCEESVPKPSNDEDMKEEEKKEFEDLSKPSEYEEPEEDFDASPSEEDSIPEGTKGTDDAKEEEDRSWKPPTDDNPFE